jgi:signal transduction histidine kinase/ligand-binding sensor domain-containing protein/CheY-like chemotaxis protein/HPt (histidine-containing phosphotransfer) domain-containing protein
MSLKYFKFKNFISTVAILSVLSFLCQPQSVLAEEEDEEKSGGGYAVTGQITQEGYTAQIYDASNGLVTSDANYILGASDGYIWIGGYSGIMRYDGSEFERLETSEGLTSGRGIFEDSKGRIWVGTNDNGVVVIDGETRTHYTYKEGMPSSSIRIFEEDNEGNVFIGTTAGVAYVDVNGELHTIDDDRINEERVLKLDADSNGKIYGQTKNGLVFSIEDCKITDVFSSNELGMEPITTILADPNSPGYIYFGTESKYIYYGAFGDKGPNMVKIVVAPIDNTHWLSYDCGRVWVSSTSRIGYLDEKAKFHGLPSLPMNSSIEMTTSDYQGNIWVASSAQGAMKIVANNFLDLSEISGMEKNVTNATCKHLGRLYMGTDNGLYVLNNDFTPVYDSLTDYMTGIRIRYVMEDSKKNLWIAGYSGEKGLVCQTTDGRIISYTTREGMPHNQIRCIYETPDGSLVVGTNGGVAILKNGKVVKTYGSEEGLKNTVILAIIVENGGKIFAATDGDGIYVIDGDKVSRIGREDGLTSDVIMKIVKDDLSGVIWLVTSNSIQYMKEGLIHEVTSFPYNNNYDIYFDDNGAAWIMSSCGIYKVEAKALLDDKVQNYSLYTIANGLPYAITANSSGTLDGDGNLYIPGRYGVIKVNIKRYYEESTDIKVAINAVYNGDTKINPDEYGRYVIPPSDERIRIHAAVMDYTTLNPTIKLFFAGREESGITIKRSELSTLEYTGLSYGDYPLHIQVLGSNDEDIIIDEVFDIVKKPRLRELLLFRLSMALLLALATGFVVYRIMKVTVITSQYDEIKKARDEAQRANTAKTRFLANISHEIRTPINTIMGMNEMIMREDPTDVPKGYFMSMMNYAFDIRNAAESLLGLINDLLDMSKIESGKMHAVETEYDVTNMLRSIVSMVRVRSTQKELTFDIVVDEMLPKKLYGDSEKIKQIVLNLLTNAVKYTDYGGFALTVTMLRREDDKCKIAFSVKDTGMGIREEDMPRIFTAYERLDEEKNSGIQGTGLGLDISRRFAELMNGTLTCESVYGEGSEFVLTVEQKIVDETPIGGFVEHEEHTSEGPYVPKFVAPDADILVVDDNPMNLSVIQRLLKATKVFVTTASSGEECLDKIAENKFNIVFLDHMMPGMDGVETLARIRERYKDLPVYALTANAALGEKYYTDKGFDGYLAKPVDSKALEETIMRHLPEEIMQKADPVDAVEDLKELPENMLWVNDVPEISVDEGIKNSGGISSFIFSLQLFLETIDGNAKVIKDAYDSGNIRLYTIKVHALKSSARIIGAVELAKLAASLEDAGNHEDMEFIDANADKFMADYMSFKEKLSKLTSGNDADDSKEAISEEELKDAYDALADVVPQMDYDAVEMIIGQLKEYKLSPEDDKKIKELEKLLRNFDWDAMEELLSL